MSAKRVGYIDRPCILQLLTGKILGLLSETQERELARWAGESEANRDIYEGFLSGRYIRIRDNDEENAAAERTLAAIWKKIR